MNVHVVSCHGRDFKFKEEKNMDSGHRHSIRRKLESGIRYISYGMDFPERGGANPAQ